MSNNELKDVLEQIEEEEKVQENNEESKREYKRTNADCLNILAYVNIALSTIGAILIWVNFSMNKVTDEINWVGIVSGIAILSGGITLFFLLKTIVDIYRRVRK